MGVIRWLALAALMTGAAGARAQDDLAARFGARDNVLDIGLAPDGNAFMLLQPVDARAQALKTFRLDSDAAPAVALAARGEPDHVERCDWTSSARLVCLLSVSSVLDGRRITGSRLVAVDAAGGAMKMLSARGTPRALAISLYGGNVIDWSGAGDAVLMDRWYVPEATTGTNLADNRDGLGVERIDTRSLVRAMVETPNPLATRYITDGRGVVRLMRIVPQTGAGRMRGTAEWRYRRRGARQWLPLTTQRFAGLSGVAAGFRPLAVDPDLDVVYGLDVADGRTAVFRIALDGSLRKELVFARAGVDVDGLVRIGRQRRVVGATWAGERRESAMFDPALAKLSAALSRALPGAPLVTIRDASTDETKLIVHAASDTDPGAFYLLDRSTRKMEEIARVRPDLTDLTLAPVKAVTYPAADGTPIPAYLTLPPGGAGKRLPAVVLPHGGPWSRDEWGFDWLPQFLAARGYAVLQPQYRGSTGFGADWFAENGFRSWRTAVGDINDGARWLASSGTADAAKLAIMGWSYGGYAALQAQVVDPALYRAAVAIAPVTDFAALRREWGEGVAEEVLDETFGTAATAQEGSPARHADRFAAPVLLFHGTHDENVAVEESRLMAARLKDAGKRAELVEFAGLDHSLDDGEARATLLRRADAFLRDAMGR